MAADVRRRIGRALLCAALALLPWQTRYIFGFPSGGVGEYGVASVYAVELLALLALTALGWKRAFAPLKPVRVHVLALAVALAVSSALGRAPLVSFGFLFHLGCAAAVGLALWTEAEDRVRQAAAFVIGLIPAAILGWFQVLAGQSPAFKWLGLASHDAATLGTAVVEAGGRVLRAYGPFSHPNAFGGFLAAGILACAWLAPRLSSMRCRRLNAFAAAVLGATLVITFSRSAMLGLALAAVLALVHARRHGGRFKNAAVLAAACGFFVSAAWFHAPLLSRTDLSNRLEAESLAERGSQYQHYAATFKVSPVFGAGPGAYTAALAARTPGLPAYAYQPIHDVPLLALAEVGLLGAAALAWLVWRVRRSVVFVPYTGVFVLALLPAALADHYLWSSWQGLALLACAWAATLAKTPEK